MSKELCDCQLSPEDELLKTECDCGENENLPETVADHA
jgi:hypothetical protein